ncbi:MAG TPA: LLM class flavin-dependent oxidoreductase [Candidatus Binataceae bacterium]|nr:LLM class flavin-dependent oxidoreductase [Candidatus Binataceae bacterium]
MRYGVYVQNFGEYGDPHNLVALALEAERAGWDGFFVWDHLLLYRHSDVPFVDAWIALAAIAARTERLRLGPVITPVARRRPWKLAREIVSLDLLSRGRAVLGVGLGAPADAEFECFGEDPSDRVRAQKLDEGLSVLDGLCRGEAFSHRGANFLVEDVKFAPRAIQSPRVPVWVAGFWPNKPPMRRAARWDGVFPLKKPPVPLVGLAPGAAPWSVLWLTPQELREAVGYIKQQRTHTRPFDVIATGATPRGEPAKARDVVKAFREAGATWWLEWLDEQRGTFAQMRERIREGPPSIH